MVDTSLSARLSKSLKPLAGELLQKPLPEELDRKKVTSATLEWIHILESYHLDPSKDLHHKKAIREWIMEQLDVDWAGDMEDQSLREAARIIQKRIFGKREREAFARCQSRELLTYLKAVEKEEWEELLHGKNSLHNINEAFELDKEGWQDNLLDHGEFALNLLERVWGSRKFGGWIDKYLVPVLEAQMDGSPTAVPLEKAVAKVWEFTKVEN